MALQNDNKRPLIVTIISVLGIIWAIISIFSGLFAVSLQFLTESYLAQSGVEIAGLETAFRYLPVIGAITLALSAASLYAFYLLLKMKKRGYILVMLLTIASIFITGVFALAIGDSVGIAGYATSNVTSIIISLLIVVYLWKNRNLFK